MTAILYAEIDPESVDFGPLDYSDTIDKTVRVRQREWHITPEQRIERFNLLIQEAIHGLPEWNLQCHGIPQAGQLMIEMAESADQSAVIDSLTRRRALNGKQIWTVAAIKGRNRSSNYNAGPNAVYPSEVDPLESKRREAA